MEPIDSKDAIQINTPRGRIYPATELIQQTLREIWSDVLGIPPPGPADSFLMLGGDSMAAVRMLSQVQDRLGVDVPLAALLRIDTLGQLVELIANLAREQKGTAVLEEGVL